MPSVTSRQIFVWSLPALFLLSFLWYKRKKDSLRSDPGGTDTKPATGVKNSSDSNACSIPVDAVKETNKTESIHSVVITPVVAAELAEDKAIQELVLVAESSAGVEATADDNNSNQVIGVEDTADERCSEDLVPSGAEADQDNILDISNISEVHDNIAAQLSSEKENNTSIEITFDSKEITPSKYRSAAQLSFEEDKDTSVEIIFDAKEIIDLEDYSSSDLICDVTNNTSIDIIYEAKINANSAGILYKDVPDLILQNNSIVDSNSDIPKPQVLANIDSDKTFSDLEFEEDCSQPEKEVSPGLNQSWAEECELETVAKEENMAREVSSDIIPEVSSNITLEGTTVEDDSSVSSLQVEVASLESKLSSIEMGESVAHVNGAVDRAAVIKEAHGNERDSANHSPAEVMLGSPSLSSYSDSQSEGSSDSGKGCSDVVTPPSRTPASGSSVSGDPPLTSVYEFVLPQHLVGRLIGRHGQIVHQIKTKTHTNIIIKRHPDTTKVKICSIEGTPMDIENALEMIRVKFPLKRYPNVTLDQVTFVSPSSCPLIPDNFQLQLVEGVNNDVILSSLVSPAHFFLQQPTHPTYPALNRLNMCMNFCYNEPTAPALPTPIAASVVCVAPTMGGWYRAQVIVSDASSDSSYIKFIDYGGYQTVENSLLRQIRSDFISLPFQAAECYLANVKPVGGVWACEAMTVVEELTQGQVIQAQIHGYAEDGVPVVYLFSIQGTQVVVVNRELVLRGYAEWDEPTEEPEPVAEVQA